MDVILEDNTNIDFYIRASDTSSDMGSYVGTFSADIQNPALLPPFNIKGTYFQWNAVFRGIINKRPSLNLVGVYYETPDIIKLWPS